MLGPEDTEYDSKIEILSSICHQEVLAVHAWNDFIACGVGSFVHLYNDTNCIQVIKIFDEQKVHFIRDSLCDNSLLFVIGGTYFAICNSKHLGYLYVEKKNKCIDWILDLRQINDQELVILNAHNQAELWFMHPLHISVRVTAEEGSCILYSANIFCFEKTVFIFAGTVFSDILVWKADFRNETINSCQTIQRIKGHKGVIFSIDVAVVDKDCISICSTSDDRSVILSYGSLTKDSLWRQTPPKYGHTARVWKGSFLADYLFTLGEDSHLICRNSEGDVLKKLSLHNRAGIRSITLHNNAIITGGGDGGVFQMPTSIFEDQEIARVVFEDVSQRARKLATFGAQGLACLTDSKLVYKRSFLGGFSSVEHVLFRNCCDMKVSCDGVLALCTTSGQLILIDTRAERWQPLVTDIGQTERCDSLLWSGSYLMLQIRTGSIHLYAIECLKIKVVTSFKLGKANRKWPTCFYRIEHWKTLGVLFGDKGGHLILWSDSHESPAANIPVHSYLGVSDLKYNVNSDTVLSIGSGGWIKETLVTPTGLIPCRSFSLPMESATRMFSNCKSMLVAGFHGANFSLWDFEKKLTILFYNCGGGHRSYDFHISENCLDFYFIKQRKILTITFNLKFGQVIRSGFHRRTINCLQTINGTMVSGSDDNEIKVSKVHKTELVVHHTFQQHICSVKGIKILQTSENKCLVFGVGGRGQLTISEVDERLGECRDLKSHISPVPKDQTQTDSRFMSVDCLQLSDDTILIVIACSDCTIQVFSWSNYFLAQKRVLRYTHCILQVIIYENWIISLATDGKATFWNATDYIDKSMPDHALALHQSGINCAVISKWADTNILVTGGDDNRLCLTTFDTPDSILSHFYTDNCHSCQITGVMLRDCWLLSTSIDQRIALHRLGGSTDVHAIWMADCLLSLPDVHGLSLLSFTTDQMVVCVYGRGIEIVQVKLKSSQQFGNEEKT